MTVKYWFYDNEIKGKIRDYYCAEDPDDITIDRAIRETEKAVCISLEYERMDGERSKFYDIWIPKSCFESEEDKAKALEAMNARFEAGKKKHDDLLAQAKALGIKGVRVNMRTATLEEKIAAVSAE